MGLSISTSQSHFILLSTHVLPEETGGAASPAIALAETLLNQGLGLGASDIHLEPGKDGLQVRCRIDGVLQFLTLVPKHLQEPLLSRFKIMAGLDIGEKRLPQDGRLQGEWEGRLVDIRVSSLPTLYGETLVLRLLDRQRVRLELGALGFPQHNLAQLRQAVLQPHGLILVTGPTGSGKSTTLYALLSTLDRQGKNIITVEDPVEYQLDGISQVAVNRKVGLDFARSLRTILRQDPDIIMLGEIRDRETAAMSIQAALTGHLVFSTLHTNTAAGAVTRLLDMGVEPYLLAAALQAAAAQQLVRVLCPHCKKQLPQAAGWERSYLGVSEQVPLYTAVGCPHCRHTGYQGRLALQEVLLLDEGLRRQILQGAGEQQLEQAACAAGMTTLWEDGRQKVLQGITSPEELLRVLGPRPGLAAGQGL